MALSLFQPLPLSRRLLLAAFTSTALAASLPALAQSGGTAQAGGTGSTGGPAAAKPAGPLPDAAQVAAYAQRLLDEQKQAATGPGVVLLVARGDQVLYRGARGQASVELGVALAPEQRFRIGSVTKQFASAALLKLIDDGRASLDDPLSKFLPAYPNGQAITVAQLLNHTSGVKIYTAIPGYMGNPVRRELSTEALVAEFKDQPADFAPGASWRYNNSGYVLVGAVIEAITGKPWHVSVDQLLQPLALTQTTYPGETRLLSGMVQGYTFSPNAPGGYGTAGLISMTQPHAAGALVSSVDDLWRWNLALHGGKVLSAKSYARMITPEGAAQSSRYGYGITAGTLRGQPRLEHGGGIHGFVSHLSWHEPGRISVVMLRNANGPGFNMDLVSRKLAAFAMGRPFPDNVAVAVPAAELQAVAGRYRREGRDDGPVLELKLDEQGRLGWRTDDRPPVPLMALGANEFGLDNALLRIKLERGADGKPTRLLAWPDGETDGPGQGWKPIAG